MIHPRSPFDIKSIYLLNISYNSGEAMSGTIHGILTRNEAVAMWQSHNHRVDLDCVLTEAIRPVEAGAIFDGSDEQTQGQLLSIAHEILAPIGNDGNEPSFIVADAAFTAHPDSTLFTLLRESNERQLKNAKELRDIELEQAPVYARKLAAAITSLDIAIFGGISWNEERLFDTSGVPLVDYTPLSFLEYVRLIENLDGVPMEPGADIYPCTDLGMGTILAPIGLSAIERSRTSAAKPHEWVHAAILGTEFYDITDDDGVRGPQATCNGLNIYEPFTSTTVESGGVIGENIGLSEGFAEHVTRELIHQDSSLGIRLPNESYGEWADMVLRIQSLYPKLYRSIAEAAMFDSHPRQTTRKHHLIDRAYQTADEVLCDDDKDLHPRIFGVEIL
jgi:hypothetical protein